MTDVKTQSSAIYLISSLLFGLFLFTLHPSITAGDSGEISAAAFSLGIPHPSGYPLYVIVAKSLTLAIPFGNIAYRVNILSAIFGTISCGMVYLITKRILQGERIGKDARENENFSSLSLSAFFASLSLALSHELWYRSTVAEVYTLNTFLVLIILYLLLAWREGGGWFQTRPYASRLLYLASFILGIGIGNHHTIVLVVPGTIAFLLWTWKSEAGVPGHTPIKNTSLLTFFFLLVFFFLLGLSIYLYLPARSFQNPFMDWGDPQNKQNFIDVFTRKTYIPENIGRDWGMFANHLKSFDPIREFTVIGLLFGLIGMGMAWKSDKRAAVMLIATSILTSYGLIVLASSAKADIGLLRKFYLPSYAIFSIFMGVGVEALLKPGSRRQKLATGLTVLLTITSLIWQLSVHYPSIQNSGNYLAYDYGKNELNSLREASVYITKGEVKTFPLWYLQGVERYREDVNVITAYFLTQRWYLKEVLKNVRIPSENPKDLAYKQMLVSSIYEGNIDKGVYTGFLDKEYIPKDILTFTQGLTFLLYRSPEERPALDVWPRYQMRGVKRMGGDIDRGVKEILTDYASSHYNTGLEYYDEGDIERAMSEFEKALSINPDDPDSLNNLAALYADKGVRLIEAETMARKAFELYTEQGDRKMTTETLKEIEKQVKGLK